MTALTLVVALFVLGLLTTVSSLLWIMTMYLVKSEGFSVATATTGSLAVTGTLISFLGWLPMYEVLIGAG